MESTIDITKYLLHSTIEEVISSDTECSETSSIIDTDDYYLNKEKLVSYLSCNTTTKLLQDKLSSESKEVIALIIDNLKGSFKDLFYGKNSNYYVSL